MDSPPSPRRRSQLLGKRDALSAHDKRQLNHEQTIPEDLAPNRNAFLCPFKRTLGSTCTFADLPAKLLQITGKTIPCFHLQFYCDYRRTRVLSPGLAAVRSSSALTRLVTERPFFHQSENLLHFPRHSWR